MEHNPEQAGKREGLRRYVVVSVVVALSALILLAVVVGVVTVLSLSGNGSSTRDDASGWVLESGATVTVLAASPVEVLDGDTASFRLENGKVEKVRMIGIDAPEMVAVSDRYTAGSEEHASQLLGVKPRVFLEKGVKERDRFGQLLAYVWLTQPSERPTATEVREKMLNARMLLDGYARVFPTESGVTYENDRYSAVLSACAVEAQEEQRGFWDPSFSKGTGYTDEPSTDASVETTPITSPYVGNATSRKFHLSTCENAKEMRVENRIPLQTRKQAIDGDFVPCGVCDP